MNPKFIRFVVVSIATLIPFIVLFVNPPHKKQKDSSKKQVEKPFVIIVPSYNNGKYCEQNLLSILNQEYRNFRVIYIDDASTDGTFEKVKNIVNSSSLKDRITLVHRKQNLGSLHNLHEAIHTCLDHEIVVRVDGDDFLAHPLVLKKLNKIYADNNVWMTYGNYLDYPQYHQKPALCEKFPRPIMRSRQFRQYKWVSTHLQTFYAGLFKKIAVEHLMKDGEFLPMAGDVAMVLPLLEMAAPHIHYVRTVMYLYNRLNPLNDHKKDLQLQSSYHEYIRSLPMYPQLEKPPYDAYESVQ